MNEEMLDGTCWLRSRLSVVIYRVFREDERRTVYEVRTMSDGDLVDVVVCWDETEAERSYAKRTGLVRV